jgi:pilus assembly protein CpaD
MRTCRLPRAAALLFAGILSACATLPADRPETALSRIVLEREVRDIALADTDLEGLRAFIAREGTRPGDSYAVLAGGTADASAMVREIASATGGRAVVTVGGSPPGRVGIRLTRVRATVRGCPDWSDAGEDFTNRPFSNFGCADAVNLAAHLADPNDLYAGSANEAAYSQAAVAAVERLRSGKVEPLAPTASAPVPGAPRP